MKLGETGNGPKVRPAMNQVWFTSPPCHCEGGENPDDECPDDDDGEDGKATKNSAEEEVDHDSSFPNGFQFLGWKFTSIQRSGFWLSQSWWKEHPP